MSLFSRRPPGTNVYEREWDLLILLDTCRVDALREVAPEYPFLDGVDSHWSTGSSSPEFMAATFTERYRDEVEGTVYVSGNGHTGYVFEHRIFPEEHLDAPAYWTNWRTVYPEDFRKLDNVWRYTEEIRSGLSDPIHVTDRAIATGREIDPERTVVHYNQPHTPHAARAIEEDRDLRPREEDPFAAIRNGVPFEEIWEQYLDELRYVLEYVEILLENFDADRAVISADHGELFGKYLHGHPAGLLHPKLRKVPWAVVEATDEGTRKSELEHSDERLRTAEERLADLGYME